MNYIYYASPVASDPNFHEKQRSLVLIAQEYAVEVHFPLTAPKSSVQEIITDLKGARVVIMDLSLERPSVYFELGLAAAIGRQNCLIAEVGTIIHQIPSGNTVRFYSGLDSYGRLIESILSERIFSQ